MSRPLHIEQTAREIRDVLIVAREHRPITPTEEIQILLDAMREIVRNEISRERDAKPYDLPVRSV